MFISPLHFVSVERRPTFGLCPQSLTCPCSGDCRQVDKFNPQSAARQASALSSFRRYGEERQALMREQLQRLLDAPGLSKDTFEIASRSLKG